MKAVNALQLISFVSQRVANLKGMSEYRDSARAIEDRDKIIRLQAISMEEKDHTISAKEEEKQ